MRNGSRVDRIDTGRNVSICAPSLTDAHVSATWSKLHVLLPSRQLRAVKVRAFVKFCVEALSEHGKA